MAEEQTAEQRDLISTLNAVLKSYGLDSMSQWIIDSVVAGKDELTIITELRSTPEYKARFPAMAEIQRKATAGLGTQINEAQYLEMERAYRQAMAYSGLPVDMWDTPDDFARLMTADVSPTEVQRRIAAAREAVDSTDENTRNQLMQMYGITTTDLMAYVLDPEKGSDYLQKVATTSILAGYSQSAGLSSLSRDKWESYAQDLISQQVSDAGIRDIVYGTDVLAEQQSRLAGIEEGQFTTEDALDSTIRRDADKIMASERRVARERARFAGTQGLGSKSLQGRGI